MANGPRGRGSVPRRLGPLDAAAEVLGRAAGAAVRKAGLGAGHSLPGAIVERLVPGYLARRAATLPDGTVAVSGTNGKTTTASMLRTILREAGVPTVGNESGANLSRGVVSALVAMPRGTRLGVFEVDEAVLARHAAELAPRVVVLTNIFRDQLDRFAETEMVAGLFRRTLAQVPGVLVVANADDPLLWRAVEEFDPLGFGVAPLPGAGPGGADAEPEACPRCGRVPVYAGRTMAHLGRASCTACGWRSPEPAVVAEVLPGGGIDRLELALPGGRVVLPVGGVHNAYNAAAAVAAAGALGVGAAEAVRGLAAFRPRFGRAEALTLGGRPAWVFLMKNPAGAGVVVREVAADPRVGAVVLAVSDQVSDGRDISWIWDADFERLAAAGLPVVPAGRRAADVAVRLRYAGAEPAPAEEDPAAALRAALARCPAGKGIAVLATYTAMLDVRHAITRTRRDRMLDVRAGGAGDAGERNR